MIKKSMKNVYFHLNANGVILFQREVTLNIIKSKQICIFSFKYKWCNIVSKGGNLEYELKKCIFLF